MGFPSRAATGTSRAQPADVILETPSYDSLDKVRRPFGLRSAMGTLIYSEKGAPIGALGAVVKPQKWSDNATIPNCDADSSPAASTQQRFGEIQIRLRYNHAALHRQ